MKALVCTTAALAGLILLGAPLSAQTPTPAPAITTSGSMALVTDYSFRGISQTQKKIAIQGGLEMDASALYLGAWGSSLNFGEPDGVVRAEAETDVVGGVRKTLAGTGFDLGFVFYGYPGTDKTYNYNYLEFALGASRSFSALTVAAKGSVSPDYFAASGTGIYVNGSLGYAIPKSTVSLLAAIGHQSIQKNAAFGTPDYMDWSAGGAVKVVGLTLGASAVGTNLKKADCFGGSELCKARLVLSIAH
jgi:uncharacterized protein (TIGR02001 family)